jgi:hypothetical protein
MMPSPDTPTRIVAMLNAAAARAAKAAADGSTTEQSKSGPVTLRTPEARKAEQMAAFFASLASEARAIIAGASWDGILIPRLPRNRDCKKNKITGENRETIQKINRRVLPEFVGSAGKPLRQMQNSPLSTAMPDLPKCLKSQGRIDFRTRWKMRGIEKDEPNEHWTDPSREAAPMVSAGPSECTLWTCARQRSRDGRNDTTGNGQSSRTDW